MAEVNPKLNSKTAGTAYSVCVLIYVLFSLFAQIIIQAAKLSPQSDGYKYIGYLSASAAILLGCAATMAYKGQRVRQVLPVKCNIKYYAIAALLFLGLFFCLSKLNNLTLELLKLMGYTPREESSYLPRIDGGYIVLAILCICVVPAMAEEFFFRGLLLQNLRSSAGDICAVLLCGFAFSLFHASPEQTVYQFICGCVFAFLTVKSGSVLPAFLMHFLNNALIIILTAAEAFTEAGTLPQTADIVLAVVGAAAFAGGLALLVLDKKQLAKSQNGGVKDFFIFGSVGIAALAIIWIMSFFG